MSQAPPHSTQDALAVAQAHSMIPTQQPFIHAVEKPTRLSKRRPSVKSQRSISGLSFHSITSSFRSSKNGKALDDSVFHNGEHGSGRPLDDDYAMVERDGRVSNDGGECCIVIDAVFDI